MGVGSSGMYMLCWPRGLPRPGPSRLSVHASRAPISLRMGWHTRRADAPEGSCGKGGRGGSVVLRQGRQGSPAEGRAGGCLWQGGLQYHLSPAAGGHGMSAAAAEVWPAGLTGCGRGRMSKTVL